MKRIWMALLMAVVASTAIAKKKHTKAAQANETTVTVVNGTKHELQVALATDYNQYNIPGMSGNYIGIDTLGPHERSPWLTGWGWKKVKKGETKHITLPAGSLCPEYLVFKPKCRLYSDHKTEFETYDAVKLVENPKKAGEYGSYSCPGEAMVTVSRRKKADKTVKCEADVTVNNMFKPQNT